MKKSSLNFLVFLFLSIGFSSCSLYSPGYINVPKYDRVGDVNVGVHVGTTADFNVSTNPVEHLSIIGNASYSGVVENEDDPFDNVNENEFRYSRYQVELGVGYYYKVNSNIQHDFHVGYGMGKAANYVGGGSNGSEGFSSNLSNIFFQSSLIFKFSNTGVDAFFSAKYNRVSFDDFEFSLIDQPLNPRVEPKINRLNYNVGQFGMGLITSLDYADLNMQAQFSISDADATSSFSVRPLGFSVGININIDKAFRDIE